MSGNEIVLRYPIPDGWLTVTLATTGPLPSEAYTAVATLATACVDTVVELAGPEGGVSDE